MVEALRLSPRDLYRLRRARLAAIWTSLKAQIAQNYLEWLTLELERHYELLGKNASIAISSGRISVNPSPQPEPFPQEGSKEAVHEPS